MPLRTRDRSSDRGPRCLRDPKVSSDAQRAYAHQTNFSKVRRRHEFRWGYEMPRSELNHWQPETADPRGAITFQAGATYNVSDSRRGAANSFASALSSRPGVGPACRLGNNTVLRAGYGITYDPLPFGQPLRGLHLATLAGS